MQQSDTTAIVLGFLSLATVFVAWVFRYRIAELAKGKQKAPTEVLFEGYEKLLKQYQGALDEKDDKILKLEQSFEKVQTELDRTKDILRKMKSEDVKKQEIIKTMELELGKLRQVHNVSKM